MQILLAISPTVLLSPRHLRASFFSASRIRAHPRLTCLTAPALGCVRKPTYRGFILISFRQVHISLPARCRARSVGRKSECAQLSRTTFDRGNAFLALSVILTPPQPSTLPALPFPSLPYPNLALPHWLLVPRQTRAQAAYLGTAQRTRRIHATRFARVCCCSTLVFMYVHRLHYATLQTSVQTHSK